MIIGHIGSWKTGTTAFQYAIKKARKDLENVGVGVVDTRSKWFSDDFIPAYRNYVKKFNKNADYYNEINLVCDIFKKNTLLANSTEHILLSWEAALGHPFNSSPDTMYHPSATAQWFRELNSTVMEVKLSLVIRDQLELVQSMYAQEIRKGRVVVDFSSFAKKNLPRNLSWKAVIQPFYDAGFKNSLKIISYSKFKDNSKLLFYSILWNLYHFELEDIEERKNLSFSMKAIEIMRRVNPLLSKEELKIFELFLVNNFSTNNINELRICSDDDEKYIRSLIESDDFLT